MRLRLAALLAAMAGVFVLLSPGVAVAKATPSPSAPTSSAATANERPTDGSYIGVTLIDSSKATKDSAGKPVPGVVLTVFDPSGTEVGKSTTDNAGQVFIPIDGKGKFTVKLDKSSLPDGVKLSGGASTSRTVTVVLDGGSFVQFQIGVVAEETTPFGERLAQSAITGLKNGLVIALAALGLSMIFGTTGLTNFSHGEIMTFGAFTTYVFNVTLGFPVIVAAVLAVAFGALYGWANERILWRPLRHRGVGLIAMMIVSIGLSLFLRSVYQFFFGSTYRSYDAFVEQRQHDYGPFSLAAKDIWVMIICVVVIAIVVTFLMTTRIGKATRAVSDNPALAASSGLRVDGVISTVWIIGVLVNVGPVFGVPESIKNAGALAVLILVLLVRPQGILGHRERIG